MRKYITALLVASAPLVVPAASLQVLAPKPSLEVLDGPGDRNKRKPKRIKGKRSKGKTSSYRPMSNKQYRRKKRKMTESIHARKHNKRCYGPGGRRGGFRILGIGKGR